MRSRSPSVCLLLASMATTAIALLTGCPDRGVTRVDPLSTSEEQLVFPAEPREKVDILFVIDDSGSMGAEQDRLKEAFPEMLAPLQELPNGAPSLHIGVISTDVGVPGGPGTCTEQGKKGALQHPSNCTAMHEAFLADEIDASGTHQTNFDGSLDEAFACMAKLGETGCGFEQPLQALRLALEPETHANDGFFREDAVLAIVFLTDEDDCSAYDLGLFASEDDQPDLGPLSSFRCFEYGITCDPVDDPRADGPRTNCHPNDESDYLTPIAEFVDALNLSKASPDQILVAAIMGTDADPVFVERDTLSGHTDDPRIEDSCDQPGVSPDEDIDGADAPIRLGAFLDSFTEGQRIQTSLCDADLSSAVREIGNRIRTSLDPRCIEGIPTDLDASAPGFQVDCVVTELQHPHSDEEHQRVLALCHDLTNPGSSDNLPCYRVIENLEHCEKTPTHLEFEIYYPEATVLPPNTVIDARCLRES